MHAGFDWAVRFVSLVLVALPGGQGGIENPDFEEGPAGKAPSGWLVPGVAQRDGYRVRRTEEDASSGKACARIDYEGEGEPAAFGNLLQSLDARS